MIMDVLGVLIAFTSVVLMLSIIVTSLVQATQAGLRLRNRNLIVGVSVLLELARRSMSNAIPNRSDRQSTARKKETKARRSEARKLLNLQVAGNLRPRTNPNAWYWYFVGSNVSWIDEETFIKAADQVGVSVNRSHSFSGDFKVIEAAMEKRFLLRMRVFSLLWAIGVAFVFQINTPSLMRDLWVNPALRNAIEAAAAETMRSADEAISTFDSYDMVGTRALERLSKMYPDAQALLEEASGIGTTKEFIVDELELILDEHPNKAMLISDYETLLEEERISYIGEMGDTAIDAGVVLASMHFEPWQKKWTFYRHQHRTNWRNVGGVLITAMLLVLGAPFWFNVLKTLTNLRDSMKERLAKPNDD